LWGFTAILGKLIHANAEILVFYRMLFAAICLFVYISVLKKKALRFQESIFSAGCNRFSMALHWYCFFYSIKVSNVSIALSCLSLSTLFASILEPLF
jgi:drug/metabolite transporter (DMT)-like permease